MPDPFKTLFDEAYSRDQQTASRWDSLVAKTDPTDEVAQRFGELVDRLTDARMERFRRDGMTDVEWHQMKTPTLKEKARQQLFEETPAEVWDIQRTHIQSRVLQEHMLKAKRQRIEELRPAVLARLKETQPEIGESDLELATIREINKILYSEGFGVIPAFKQSPMVRGKAGEAIIGMARGGASLIHQTQAFYSDLLGQAAEKAGDFALAEQFYASGAGARERGADKAEALRQSEDLEAFDPENARWWISHASENVPQFALMLAGGYGAGAVARSVGAGVKATQALQKIVAAGGVGSMEASAAYESSLQQLVDSGIGIEDARGLAAEQALVVGAANAVLESIAVGEFVTKIPGGHGRLIRAVRGAVIEGSTEGLQETTAIMGEAYAKAKASGDTTVQALADMGRPVPEQIERILTSFAIGAILGAPTGAMTRAEVDPQTGQTIDPAEGPPPPGESPATGVEDQTVIPFPQEPEAKVFSFEEARAQAEEARGEAETIPFPTTLREAMPEAEGESTTLKFPETTERVLPFKQAPEAPPSEARTVEEPPVIPFKRQAEEGESKVTAPKETADVAPGVETTPASVVVGEASETRGPAFPYTPQTKPSVSDLQTMRTTMKSRTYPANRVVHTTTLKALEGISKTGIQPSESFAGEMGVYGSWTNGSGQVAGGALSYGGSGVPVVVVLSPDVKTQSPAGDTIVASEGKSYVDLADIEGVFVGADPSFYTLENARRTYGDLREAEGRPALESVQRREVRKPTRPMSPRAERDAASVKNFNRDAPGSTETPVFRTYEEASKSPKDPKGGQNVWVRQTSDASNENRILLVQWNSDLLQTGDRTRADDYYDKLYANREGYARADDFWELPQWIGQAAHNLPTTDVYVVRDADEAVRFFEQAQYGTVAFSVLDVNKALVKDVANRYGGRIAVGGYVDFSMFDENANVTAYPDMRTFVEENGQSFKQGTDFRHFQGTEVVPRLCLSEGCLHKCAFCVVPKDLKTISETGVDAQVQSFGDLDYRLVYVNDKTFGQAENFRRLEDVSERLHMQNPNFEGFIIQTTAAQMRKLDPAWMRKIGIRYVELGVESYNDDILKAMHKPANTKLIDEAVTKLRANGMSLIPNVMIGLPGETKTSYENTLRFLSHNRDIISHANVYNLAVYKGTELADVVGNVSEGDLNENNVAKSFHENPKLHESFANALYKAGDWLLDKPPITIATPTAVETVPTVEPLDGPADVPIPGDGAGVVATSLTEEIRTILSDETGGFDPDVVGRTISGGITTATEEAGTLLTGLTALTDESAILRKSGPGSLAVEIVDSATSRATAVVGRYETAFRRVWKTLPRASKRWLETIREDGQTNHATLIEHPERISEELPEGVAALIGVETAMKEDLGDEAERVKLPQRKRDGSLGPFQKAESGRFFRVFSQKGYDALRYQQGPMWNALIQWFADHPDRNPNLPADEMALKEKLQGERKSGATRKSGSLEYSRLFEELPVALWVNGKWEMLQEGRPLHHFRTALTSQARRIYFWDEAQTRLLPQFGQYDEGTGQIEFPHPQSEAVVDVDGLVDRLRRMAVAAAAKRPRSTERAFNRLLENYFRQHRGGLIEEVTTITADSKLAQVASAISKNLMASILSFSGLWDILQPTAGSHIVGAKNTVRAYARTLVDIVSRPREFAAEYQAIGAVTEGFEDWSLRSDRRFLDFIGKTLPQAQLIAASFTERMAQTMTARAFDTWAEQINGNLKDRDAGLLKKHLRLTDQEILEVARGGMSPDTKTKIIQNGVKTTNYLAEDPHRRGLLRNVPLLKWLVPFTSVMNGSMRAAGRVLTDITDNIRKVQNTKDPQAMRDLMHAAGRLMTFVTLAFGRGLVQKYLRRAVTGRPMVDPEDPDSWYALALEGLGEGAVFGPYYRILEASKYSGGDPERYVVNLVPRIAILLELATAIGGVGKYENSPWADRLERAGLRFSPIGRTFRNWYDRLVYPERQDYTRVRKLVRKFNRDRGVKMDYGSGPRNYLYYKIFEAIRDGDEDGARTAIALFKQKAQAEGLDPEEARTRLRSSLQSRRPINLSRENLGAFLKTLDPPDRALAETAQRNYDRLLERFTGSMSPRPPRAPRAPKPTVRGNWYGTE